MTFADLTSTGSIWYLVLPLVPGTTVLKKNFLKVVPGTKCEKLILLGFSTGTKIEKLNFYSSNILNSLFRIRYQ